ncbi:MAG: M18 family aminopeptidase [Alphaproteobacteria bacterium]|nr:M18 family aminopeptidase [Alphaproteobacteria bacterium]MCB9793881.1 M18 family aminopeptidase [Alphaproteobacteria bacterium]
MSTPPIASAQGLVDFIAASPTPYHCVAEAARRLDAAGFTEQDEGSAFGDLQPGDKRYVRRGGTIVAWVTGTAAPMEAGFRVVGAHTDSPNLRLKPRPEFVREGYVQWGLETYGGLLTHTWVDRDLGLSGRVSLRDGEGVRTQLIRVERPIARVPHIAIHLHREVKEEGYKPNAQTQMPPVIGLWSGEGEPGALHGLLSATLDCAPSDILGFDLMLHDLQPPTIGGLNGEFVFAPRLDNQACCYAGLSALCALSEPPRPTAIVALHDHEECGSLSAVGADSSFLEMLIERIGHAHVKQSPGGLSRSACNSLMVSADMAHGVHPNYPEKHDGNHKPALNGGPVIKHNVNQRYATTGITAAWFARACEAEDVAHQSFITRADMRCGTTIGPMSSARLGFPTVDVGCAMLSMHSIREQTGAHDVEPFARVLSRVLRGG